MSVRFLTGDALDQLRTLDADSVHCCVTSPPYWGLRDYGVAGQIGLERTPDKYVARIVGVFREVRRVLRGDGTLWLNMGDSYVGSANAGGDSTRTCHGLPNARDRNLPAKVGVGLKPKDLVGIPWRVAFALQADGWYLRSDIIWSKPNPMPESVRDRPTKAHEYVFLLSKSERYAYDADAIAEPATHAGRVLDYTGDQKANGADPDMQRTLPRGRAITVQEMRNARTVWTIPGHAYPEAHFATFPPELARRCILAGCPKGGTVLDPFGGAGTTGLVADRLGRSAILIELNPAYVTMAQRRIRNDAPLFAEDTAL